MIFCKTRPELTVSIHSEPHFTGEWDEILPQGHHLNKSYLKVLFEAELPHLKHFFVQLYLNKKVAGVMYFQVLTLDSSHMQMDDDASYFSDHFQKLIYKFRPSVLVCGNLFRIDWPGYYFTPVLQTEDLGYAMNEVWDSLKNTDHLVGILFKDLDTRFSTSAVKELGFKSFGEDQTMEVSILPNWKSFSDYENNLTKKYRQRAKKIIQASEFLREESWDEKQIKLNSSIIESLYNQVVEKQSVRLGTINADYFVGLKKCYGADFEFKVLYFKDTPVGFYSMLFYPEKRGAEIHYIGFDYALNEQFQIYFSILFRGLEAAISHNAISLELGRTARDAKASLGAKPRTIRNYIRLRRGLVTLLFNLANRWFLRKMDEKWIDRNPFKASN